MALGIAEPAALAAAAAAALAAPAAATLAAAAPATTPAAIIVVGSEVRGLSAGVKAALTQRVTIPAYGRAESLNAAVAAAIVCDNLRRLTTPR